MTILSFFVPGRAVPQGSKRHVGRGVMVEMGKDLHPWRESVRWECRRAAGTGKVYPEGVPVSVVLEFVLPRPKAAPKRTTPAATKRPDIDKLERAILDALGSSGVWHDDAQVTKLTARKRLATIEEIPGVHITISPDTLIVANTEKTA